jgi:hypothetical protein
MKSIRKKLYVGALAASLTLGGSIIGLLHTSAFASVEQQGQNQEVAEDPAEQDQEVVENADEEQDEPDKETNDDQE